MIRAAIYCRVSTDQQAQEGDSIAAQLDALTKYVNDRSDMVLADEYIDEGISGRKADRDELQRLLDDVAAGKVDVILFTKLDRWFRSVRHYTATQELLDKKGVTWTAIWEPIYDTTTPAGRLIVNQMMSIAQFEAENTSQRIRAVMAYKVEQGEAVTGKVPMGYRIEDKHLIPTEEADFVRQVFAHYSASGSLNETARFMQAHGVQLQKQNIKYMLKNRKYIGEHRGNLAYCPPIVERELFDDVQHKLSMNISKSAKHVNIFKGILKCGCCGRSMAACHDAKKGNAGYDYYRCPGYYVPPRRCENRRIIGEKAIEKYLIEEAQQIARTVKVEATAKKKKVEDHSKQLAAIDRKIGKLKELFLAEQITLEEYKSDRAELEAQKKALAETPKEAEPDLTAVNEILSIKDMKSLIEALSASERQYLWRGLIREIVFYPDRHFEVHFW